MTIEEKVLWWFYRFGYRDVVLQGGSRGIWTVQARHGSSPVRPYSVDCRSVQSEGNAQFPPVKDWTTAPAIDWSAAEFARWVIAPARRPAP